MKNKAQILIRFSALGDLVLCSAFLQKVQKYMPQDKIFFLTHESFRNFVQKSFPQPLEALSLKATGILGYFLEGFRLLKSLQESGFDSFEIYDLHNVGKSKAFLWGFCLRAYLVDVQVLVKRISKKTFLRSLSVFLGRDLLGNRYNFSEPLELLEPKSDKNFYPKLLPHHQTKQISHILVAPDAKHWKKRWPSSHWENLLPQLLHSFPNLRITLVGGKSSLPLDFQDELKTEFQDRVDNRLGKTSLEELPQIASQADICLSGNSAWLHISEAVGIDSISFAGPIVPGFGFSPWRSTSREFAVSLGCRPCTRHGSGLCRYVGEKFHACMTQITPPEVFEEVKKRIELLKVNSQ